MAKRAPGRHRQRSITLAKALLCFGNEAAVGVVLRRGQLAEC